MQLNVVFDDTLDEETTQKLLKHFERHAAYSSSDSYYLLESADIDQLVKDLESEDLFRWLPPSLQGHLTDGRSFLRVVH